MTTHPDGPLPPNCFAWDGAILDGLAPGPWRLVAALWDAPNGAASLDVLAMPVFDRDTAPDRHVYAPTCTRANKFFKWHGLPFTVRACNRHLQLVRHPD
jgi:hypothetical protein